MSEYRMEWDCCGSVTITDAFVPDKCPLCEIEALQQRLPAAEARIKELEAALSESQANDRTAMGYLKAIRAIVGGDDYREVTLRIEALKACAKP
jgi:hypothetical protein